MPTLVYAKTSENCDDPGGVNCHRLDAVGGVAFVTGQTGTPMLPGIPAPVMLAFAAHDPASSKQVSQGLIAVVPAETPVFSDFENVPRAAPNGPVEVFRSLGGDVRLLSSVHPVGTVRAISLGFRQLAVLVEHPTGRRLSSATPGERQTIGTTARPGGHGSGAHHRHGRNAC